MSNSDNRNANVNQMNQDVKKSNSPKTVRRVDQANLRLGDTSAHVHFTDGSALKDNGTWKHGERDLSRTEKDWLKKYDWKLP